MALGALLAGCSPAPEPTGKKPVTPNAQPPATTPQEASGILRDYLAAMSDPDSAIKSSEASTAQTVHVAQLRLGDVTPNLAAEFAIPRFTSYPKWFAAGAVRPGATGDVAIFVQSREDAPWRVHRLVRVSHPMPELSRDAEGYVTVAGPGDVPARRAKDLAREIGEPGVAAASVERAEPRAGEPRGDGDATTPLVDALRGNIKLFTGYYWTVQHKTGQQGRSYALRTKDGGTVVWYVLSYNFTAVNNARRFEITLADEAARMLRAPVVGRTFTWTALYQSVAHAPAAGDDRVLGVTLPGWTRMGGA